MSSAVSSLQTHSGLLPKDREGMSASAFLTPGMWTGVSGHALWRLRLRARARTSLAAMRDFREANLSTQLTVSELSLKEDNVLVCNILGNPLKTQPQQE